MKYQNLILFILCILTSSTQYGMKRPLEAPYLPVTKKPLLMPEKPVLFGYLSLSTKFPSASYGSQEYHTSLCESGIPSRQEYPLLKVHVIVEGKDWTVKTPHQIVTYEKKAYKCAQRTDISHDELLQQIVNKTFPSHIPAPLLYNTTAESELTLTIHGYQTTLICVDNLKTRRTFMQQYNNYLENFSQLPLLMPTSSAEIRHSTEQELINKQLITVTNNAGIVPLYLFGQNGFTTIEKLLIQEKLERTINRHTAIMNRQLIGNKKQKIRLTQHQQKPQ